MLFSAFNMEQQDYSSDKISRLQIVPWFSKKEWLETYHQVFSEDLELQEKAYTQMCIWKARYPNLPMGVECTMSMLHVRLCDRQSTDNVVTTNYKDRDLQLLYSTAVMRFLNHLTMMSNWKDTMYKMAEEHQIPDWLINLRHQAAHGNSVPALYLLRQAGDIIMQWLWDHYWEVEVEVSKDVINQEGKRESESRKITQYLELWLILKMNYWAGRKTIDRIPNEDIRKQAMDLAKEEGLGIKRVMEVEPKKRFKKGKLKEESVGDCEMPVDREETAEYTHKIKTAFEPLLRKLFDPLKAKVHRMVQYRGCLVESLVKYEGFCPQIDVEKLGETEVLQLMSLQGELWKEVLEGLQSHRLLHCVLTALLSCARQLPTAHLWLRLLTQVLSGDPPSHPPASLSVCQLLAGSLPYHVEPEVLFRKANLHHVKHQRPLDLKPASAKEMDVLQHLAQEVLNDPSRFTSKYLNSLLGLWETPLSADSRVKLCVLARIYNGQQSHRRRPDKVFTVASLGTELAEDSLSDSDVDANAELDTSPWALYSGEENWSQCALGALPW